MLRRQHGEDIGRIFIETPVEITDIIKTRLSPWVDKREKKCLVWAKKCSWWSLDIKRRVGCGRARMADWLSQAPQHVEDWISAPHCYMTYYLALSCLLCKISFIIHMCIEARVPCECRLHNHEVSLNLTNSRTQDNKALLTGNQGLHAGWREITGGGCCYFCIICGHLISIIPWKWS